jgi:hypothetical protein
MVTIKIRKCLYTNKYNGKVLANNVIALNITVQQLRFWIFCDTTWRNCKISHCFIFMLYKYVGINNTSKQIVVLNYSWRFVIICPVY